MKKIYHLLLCLFLIGPGLDACLECKALAQSDMQNIRKSVVRIQVVAQQPDYRVPWSPGRTTTGWGSGFIISGNRILTNAHVSSDTRFITIEKEGDGRRYEARVSYIAHDCDLALLEVVDKNFFAGTRPLAIGGVPDLDSEVTVVGYPIGGDRISVTRGVVSRIDYQVYSHSGVDSHLAIQIDAAINPGNSGGPVLQDNRVVGVAFQGYSGLVAQNVGYMIPVPVIRRFLKDVADGHYDRYVDLGIQFFPLINPAQRRALGLAPGDYGVMVSDVMEAGGAYGVLETGDVLLKIDGKPIFSDGYVAMDGARLLLNEVVERKFKGDHVEMEIMRSGRLKKVKIELTMPWPYLMLANRHDQRPRYVLFAGLVFQPLSNPLFSILQKTSVELRYFYSRFVEKGIYRDHPEVIVISRIIPDPANIHLKRFTNAIVDRVNGKAVRTLEELYRQLEADSEFYVIELLGNNRPIVLTAKAASAAKKRMIEKYGIKQQAYLKGGIVPAQWRKTDR